MQAYLFDWLNLLLRWLHLITGVAWIGASFYFVMLDNSLEKPAKKTDSDRGVSGELWAVHGGGLYQSQKYLSGPVGEALAQNLHWSKWEAYSTWMSGMGLLVVIYWFGANSYLIDARVLDLSVAMAISISIGFIIGGWIIYDWLCKLLAGKDGILAAILFILISLSAYSLFQLLSARAAYLHVGAIMGTIMAANVFFQIIPGQKRMVAQMRAGEVPDAQAGIIGKQRSVHNTYFTLPVLFIMISNHYPMTYSHDKGWLVLIFMMLAGALIRQYFVFRHRGKTSAMLPLAAVVLLLSMIWYLAPESSEGDVDAGRISLSQVQKIIQQRCVSCHGEKPSQVGFANPPLGIVLQSKQQIIKHAKRLALSVHSRYMPLANLTAMTERERKIIALWSAQLK